jgi:hypothetical protein
MNETFGFCHLKFELLEVPQCKKGKMNKHNAQLNPNPKQLGVKILSHMQHELVNVFGVKGYCHVC